MKSFFCFFLILMTICEVKSQINKDLINKSFSAKIGSVCEETSSYSVCAGYQIYLTMKFTDFNIEFTVVGKDACKVRYSNKYWCSFKYVESGKMKIENLEKIKDFGLENNTLYYKDNRFYGNQVYESGNKEEIVFEPNK